MAALIVMFGSGCVPERLYHDPSNHHAPSCAAPRTSFSSKLNPGGFRNARDCSAHAYAEINDSYELAYLEIDDSGNLQDPGQLEEVNSLLVEEAARPNTAGALVVLYVHGWKHNASVCDSNVVGFRWTLESIAKAEALRSSRRRVIGVYVGWRGLSISMPALKEATFWSRESAAKRVGEGDVRSVISGLAKRVDHMRETSSTAMSAFIVIGHSLGGSAVFHASKDGPAFHYTSLQTAEESRSSPELVVLANPAIEAAAFEHSRNPLHVQSIGDERPRVIVATAINDTATAKWFPLGRMAKQFLEGDTGAFCRENDPRVLAVGHYPPYHDFDIVPRSQEAACFQLVPYEQLSEGWAVNIAEMGEGGATWPWEEQRPAGDPSVMDCFANFQYEPQSYEWIDRQWVGGYMSMVEEEGMLVSAYAEMFGSEAIAQLRRDHPECIHGAHESSEDGPAEEGNVVCIDENLEAEIRRHLVETRFHKPETNDGGAMRVGRFCLQPVNRTEKRPAVTIAWASRSLIDEHNGFFNQGFLDFLLDLIIESDSKSQPAVNSDSTGSESPSDD
jgi:pimeloyl-ACP methyl ester carboxylesterase